MQRTKFLILIIHQAARNGFDFEKWYTSWLGCEWLSEAAAVHELSRERRYFSLLFSHEFACAFWMQGSRITFMVPASKYTLRDKSGALIEVNRKPYTRRRLKADAWKYHLREMSCSDEPLRYIRRYVMIPEPGVALPDPGTNKVVKARIAATRSRAS